MDRNLGNELHLIYHIIIITLLMRFSFTFFVTYSNSFKLGWRYLYEFINYFLNKKP